MNDGTAVATDTPVEAKYVAPPPVKNEDSTYTLYTRHVLPASLEVRKALASQCGFAEIKEIGEAKKSKDPKVVERAKEYTKLIAESRENYDSVATVPDAEKVPTQEVQDFIFWSARTNQRAFLLSLRRKGEDVTPALNMAFNSVLDFMDEDDDGTDWDEIKEVVQAVYLSLAKARNYNETTLRVAGPAILGYKSTMLIAGREVLPSMEKAQEAFLRYASELGDVDFDGSIVPWMKRQERRLQSAKKQPVIQEQDLNFG